MSPQALAEVLAPLNAALNASSAALLLLGFRAIRGRRPHRHRACMLGAVAASALFLASYVTRFSLTGSHRIAAEGWARTLYVAVLFLHMALAVIIVPLVILLLHLVRHHRFHAHARLARWTFPLWLYVSLTGLAVYLMLYHIFGYQR